MKPIQNENDAFDLMLKDTLFIDETPASALNDSLKQQIYHLEKQKNTEGKKAAFSFWYFPMLLNTLLYIIIAFISHYIIFSDFLNKFIMGILVYNITAGIVLTLVGLKYFNLKEAFRVNLNDGGAFQ